MKRFWRILALVITSPVWVLGGAVVVVAVSPFLLMDGIISVINFAFTGEWEMFLPE